MKENEKIQQPLEEPIFVEKVMKWFQTLMDKFTEGKYVNEQEKRFFSEESNLYKADGSLTDEYQAKIKEFEEQMQQKDVRHFLKDIHSVDSEEFGKAYNDDEKQILNSACSFIDDQDRIVRMLEQLKKEATLSRKKFDFEKWFAEYANQQGITDEHIEEAKQSFVGTMKDVLDEDPALKEIIQDSFVDKENFMKNH